MARDPARIDGHLEALCTAWKADPDLRLGQLIYNAASTQRRLDTCPDLFNMEDALLINGLVHNERKDMSDNVGTVTVRVLPDLAEFKAIVAAVPDAGLTVTEDRFYERNEEGQVTRETVTRTITAAS